MNGQVLGLAKEEPSGFVKAMRLLVNKRLMPTRVCVYEPGSSTPLVTMSKGVSFLRAKLTVTDREGRTLGLFHSKLFSLGGGFWVHDQAGARVAEVKGDWKGWNFRFLGNGGSELGAVTKKWAGAAKELFASADNYVVALSEPAEKTRRPRCSCWPRGLPSISCSRRNGPRRYGLSSPCGSHSLGLAVGGEGQGTDSGGYHPDYLSTGPGFRRTL